MTAPQGTAGGDEVAAIRGDIVRTRGEMSRTVNEIEERLSPAHLKEQVASVAAGVADDIKGQVSELKVSVLDGYHEVKDHLKEDLGRELRGAKHKVADEMTHARAAVREATVGKVEHMVHDARETVTDAGTTVLDTIKANPIPSALVALGIGWLIMSGRSSRPSYGVGSSGPRLGNSPRLVGNALHAAGEGISSIGHRVQGGASHLVEGAQGAAHGAGEAVSHFAHDAGHRVEEIAGGARDAAVHLAGDASRTGRRVVRGAGRGFRRAEQGFESTLRTNPLALGAVAIAVGAAIGLSLPHTHVEDEWMGDAKDRLIHRAEGVAGEAIHKAEEAVGQLSAGEKTGDEKTPDTKNGLRNGMSASSKSQAI